jgi:hypothetical protein
VDYFRIIAPEVDAWESSLCDLPYDFFHTSAFARAWQAEVGSPVRLIVYRQGNSSVILPIVFRAIETNCSRALKDAVSAYGFPGPVMVAEPGVDRLHLAEAFIEWLRTGLRQIGCVSMFVRMKPLSPVNELFRNAGAKLVVQGPIAVVDLTRPMQEVRASYRNNHRRDIRKLVGAGFEPFQQETGWADSFYEIYSQSMQRRSADAIYFFSREMFHLLEEIPHDYLRFVGCRRAGEIVCAALITRGAGVANYFLGGTRANYLGGAPAKLMLDQAFEWEQSADSHCFILGGGLGSHVDGVLNFKLGFSKLTSDYVTWREIFNIEEYQALVSETATTERDQRELSLFFPPYRCRKLVGLEMP